MSRAVHFPRYFDLPRGVKSLAHLFRPITVKRIPPGAQRCLLRGKPAVRWKNRSGGWTVAELSDRTPGKCRVESPYWWVEWVDAGGLRQREKVSLSRDVATTRMGDIMRDVQRERDGLAPLSKVVTAGTLHALAEEFRDHLKAHGRSEQHYKETFRQVTAVAAECSWTRVQDVTFAAWSKWVGRQTAGDDGMAAETVNHYLRSLRGFFRWLIRSRRLGADPLAAARLLKVEADRRLTRRALSPEEFRRFVEATRKSGPRLKLDGPSRAALYLVAARTGLRAGTLATLRREDLRLDDVVPNIPTRADQQKNRKDHVAPLAADLVAEVRAWAATRPAGELLWPGKWHSGRRASGMVARDLAACGIPYRTPDGQFDFHALRGQCGTDLALAGVPLVVAQKFLGHSTPALTAKYYVRLGLIDLAGAAESVGRQLGWSIPKEPQTLGAAGGRAKGPKARKKPGGNGKR